MVLLVYKTDLKNCPSPKSSFQLRNPNAALLSSFPPFSFLSLSFPYTNLELKAGLRSIVATTSHTDDPPSLAPPQKQLVLDAHPTTPLHSTSLGLALGLAVFRHPSLPQPADSGTCDDLLIRSLYVWPSPEIALVSTLASGFPAAEQQ
jgi:hypothetical protein